MTRIFATVLILAMFIPAAKPSCQVWLNNNGRRVCWCYGTHGWRTAPMLACKVWR